MKRIIILCLILSLLLACVPTPEEEYIVTHGDNRPPTEAEVSDEAVGNPISVPAHASLNADPTEHVSVVVDADVAFDPNALHPILEAEALDFTQDSVFSALLSQVGSGAKLYEKWEDSKAEVGERLSAAMQYDGQLGELVDPDISIKLLQDQFNSAPETPEKIPVSKLECGKNYYLEQSDGTISLLVVNFESNSIMIGRDIRDDYWTEDFIGPNDPIVLSDPEISETDARAKAEAFMKALGVECDCLVETQRGFSTRYYELSEMLWRFTFVRSIDGTPSLSRPKSFMTSPDTPSSVGAPWSIESAWVYVGKDGVVCANFQGLTKIMGITVKNAQLCEFDKVLDMAVRQIGYLHDGATDKPHHTYTVTNINLCYGMQAKKDDLSVGVYQPMWEVTYVDAEDPDAQPSILYISALTGGHVEPRLTVQTLMRNAE
ncbi:MAG: hypothetical protein II049_00325 [Clostridia bacterium]|nr:hypothetical protein [Clostridia bacterium]